MRAFPTYVPIPLGSDPDRAPENTSTRRNPCRAIGTFVYQTSSKAVETRAGNSGTRSPEELRPFTLVQRASGRLWCSHLLERGTCGSLLSSPVFLHRESRDGYAIG